MDCNNYSYTTTGFLNGGETIAEYRSDAGYIDFTLEQWGTNPNIKKYVVSGFMVTDECIDISEDFTADFTEGWETARYAYAKAATLYNRYVPESEAIPTF